jgi:hypothetical protein
VDRPPTPAALHEVLAEATGPEAQLLLSFYVWPQEVPDPRLVDKWMRSADDTARGMHRGMHHPRKPGITGTPDPLNHADSA